MIKKISLAAAALAFTGVGLVAPTVTASADAAPCPTGWFLYDANQLQAAFDEAGGTIWVNHPDVLALDAAGNANGTVCISLPPSEKVDIEVKEDKTESTKKLAKVA